MLGIALGKVMITHHLEKESTELQSLIQILCSLEDCSC
jgi:hypothetical protein